MKRIWLGGMVMAMAAGIIGWSCVTSAQAPATAPAIDPTLGKGKVIGLDAYYNQEKNGAGFHYHWDDTGNPGMSKFGDVWKSFGATLAKLDHAPTRADLDKFSVYMIVNPSLPTNAVTPGKPNVVSKEDADVVEAWVKDGGVLMFLLNDKTNTDIEHTNIMASRFGITFNSDRRNEVPNAKDRTPGMFDVSKLAPDEPLFKGIKQIYMKEISTLTLKEPAKALLTVDAEKPAGAAAATEPGKKDIIIATAKVGKGFVFAVGDPWIYNEYIDVVSTPGLTLENRKAAVNLARWILPMSGLPAAAAK